MNKATIQCIFKRFQQQDPAPKTELHYASSFELLIAVMLSAQATDISVNKATPALFAAAPTPEAMLQLSEEVVKQFIKTIGLYNTKAKNILKTCRILVEQHEGKVPASRAALEALPGVGRKTANVVLSIAFGAPTLAVDTHIFRVANRTGMALGKTPLSVELALLEKIDKKFLPHAHHWLILHGRYTCMAKKPRCPQCLISDLCEYSHKTTE